MDHLFALEEMILENETLVALKFTLTNELKEAVTKGRQDLKKMKVCAHESNDLNMIFACLLFVFRISHQDRQTFFVLRNYRWYSIHQNPLISTYQL